MLLQNQGVLFWIPNRLLFFVDHHCAWWDDENWWIAALWKMSNTVVKLPFQVTMVDFVFNDNTWSWKQYQKQIIILCCLLNIWLFLMTSLRTTCMQMQSFTKNNMINGLLPKQLMMCLHKKLTLRNCRSS